MHFNVFCCSQLRKRALLLFLHNTKQRLLRLLIIVKWANKVLLILFGLSFAAAQPGTTLSRFLYCGNITMMLIRTDMISEMPPTAVLFASCNASR